MTVLVTGGAGFVGLNIVEALIERGESVVIFDRMRRAVCEPLQAARSEFAIVPAADGPLVGQAPHCAVILASCHLIPPTTGAGGDTRQANRTA